MKQNLSANRRRGGQPGNQNAKGNRGNLHPRRNLGNRGGSGAPRGNQHARRQPKTPDAILLKDYQHDSEAVAWIKAHATALRDASFSDDETRDRALLDGYLGLTPEILSEGGAEFRLGLYNEIPPFMEEEIAA